MDNNHSKMTGYPLEQSMAVLKLLKLCQTDEERLNVIRDALREGYEFRDIAYYLADCHAATLESLPKAASKSMRSRLESLTTAAATMLRHAYFSGRPSYNAGETRERVIARLERREGI